MSVDKIPKKLSCQSYQSVTKLAVVYMLGCCGPTHAMDYSPDNIMLAARQLHHWRSTGGESRRNARDLAGFNPAVRRRLRQKTAGETPAYRQCFTSRPPKKRQRTASEPPKKRQRSAIVPSVDRQRNASIPPKKRQRTVSVPPADRRRNASVPPVYYQQTAGETQAYHRSTAEFLSERATGYPLANIQCSGDLLAQI
ncbi:putative T-lymphoma invasion and metastasis-inducing protein 2 isoform X1 [Apostichopus japonicus]|uniref:Putative T-lymphoma invasion and metastasis-inducing protein 2 isoform X1 n=1 Tax=Stichopus japonicus TaxID=307972 RepID=A0A2G8KEX1_STIJA|nr:putative T-lymphoma invasion and metastasis-inducing protein 2 isoform X1 [Apostichopus japonicus]